MARETKAEIKADRDRIDKDRKQWRNTAEGLAPYKEKYEKLVEEDRQFLKGLVLHLTSKPVKINHGKNGNVMEDAWKEASERRY